ncbi:MAG: cellulase family glycosylhydrolase [Clostridia bacterium]|nr:cellulase family glycosylhydrolase [Clostridia bacterium]
MLKELGFFKGVNLGGWMSQCDYSEERLHGFIRESDYQQIAEWGFDHVRLPVDYNVIQNADGSMKEEGLRLIDHALELAEKHRLNTVLDLHKTQGFSFDAGEHEDGFFESEKYQEYFYTVWECFAKRYGTHGGIMFDLLNEVTEERYIGTWNRVSQECIRRIRESATDVPILVGSYRWNSAKTVPELNSPLDDHVFYNFHFYEPIHFTHQGAYWRADTQDISLRFSYLESGMSEQFVEDFIASALAKAEKERTELYCGEYGVIDVVPPEEAVKWFRTVHSVFEKHGIGRCLWSYKQMDFGLSDARLDGVREELLKVL